MAARPNWDRIRAHYRHHDLSIHQAGASVWGIDPYAWEHEAGIRMTPIEAALWHDIRHVGAVLYPQFPVGRRFVDFGNPVAKVAIECDGRDFHTDELADLRRQREIEAYGWTVYRLPGSECAAVDQIATDPDTGAQQWRLNPGFVRVREIAEAHGIRLWSPRRRAAA